MRFSPQAIRPKLMRHAFLNRMKMRILISNDDGIYSPGIAALAKVASRFGEVRIVAPDVEQSSMSHAITASRPLRYKRIRLDDFAHIASMAPLPIALPSARIIGDMSISFFPESISVSTSATPSGISAR
jgi:hypothetical protein